MTDDEVARLAREAGLETYLAKHPSELATAFRAARAVSARLPRDLIAAEESAHTFELPVVKEPRP